MKFKNWLYLFVTTLGIGAIASILVGLYFWQTDPEFELNAANMIVTAGAGMMFSVLSQMGFFAYMMLNFIVRTLFRKRYIWTTLQWILVGVVFVDLIYLRFISLEADSLFHFSIFPILLMAVSLLTAWWKVRLTQITAFTPTVFFMFVATSLESIPALRENSLESMLFMVVPLVLCNAWQILNLHRLVENN